MEQIIQLLTCALTNTKPAEIPADLDAVFKSARRHRMAALIGTVLKENGTEIGQVWEDAISRAKRDYLLATFETSQLFMWMDQQAIPHMALKGYIIQHLYSQPYLRERHDVDLLVEPGHMEVIREYMLSHGYNCVDFGSGYHDVYVKEPGIVYEIHEKLVPGGNVGGRYYANVWERLVPVKGSEYAFTDEDFYIFFIVHAYKHHVDGGVGLRTLSDLYLWLNKKEMNTQYIEDECKKLGIAEFEKTIKSLSLKLFCGESLNAAEKELLGISWDAGVFGTVENRVKHEKSKVRYFFRRLFPPVEYFREKHMDYKPVLLPCYWLYFVIRNLTKNQKSVKQLLSALFGMETINR